MLGVDLSNGPLDIHYPSLRTCGTPCLQEGTVGSTGVSLAMVAAAYGIRCFIAMPDDAAIEKSQMLEALGATYGAL